MVRKGINVTLGIDRIIWEWGGWGGERFTEGICPLLCHTLSETTEDMFSCDMAQIIMVLKGGGIY